MKGFKRMFFEFAAGPSDEATDGPVDVLTHEEEPEA